MSNTVNKAASEILHSLTQKPLPHIGATVVGLKLLSRLVTHTSVPQLNRAITYAGSWYGMAPLSRTVIIPFAIKGAIDGYYSREAQNKGMAVLATSALTTAAISAVAAHLGFIGFELALRVVAHFMPPLW